MKSNVNNLVTLQDVATKAGVSRPVVSKVLLDAGGNIRVGEETQQRVRTAAKELGYLTNHIARQLTGKASRIIGVLIDSYAPLIYYRWLAEMERITALRGYMFMVGQSHGEQKRMQQYADNFCGRGIDGVICMAHDYGIGGADVVKMLSRIKNVVFIGKPSKKHTQTHYVSYDITEAIRMVVRHLYSTGRRRIGAFLYEDDSIEAQGQRLEGYKLGLADVGLKFDENLIQRFGDSDSEGISQADIERGSKEFAGPLGVDAIIANNDVVAAKVITQIRKYNKTVPNDIAVTGFDNAELSADLCPSLTTIDLPPKPIAEEAVNLLLDLIEGKQTGDEITQKKLIPNLIIRESTAKKN